MDNSYKDFYTEDQIQCNDVTVTWNAREVKKSFTQKIVAAAKLAENVGRRCRDIQPKDVCGKIAASM